VAPVALAPTKPALVTTSTPAPGAAAQPKVTKTTVAAAPTAPKDGRTAGHQYLVLGSYPNQADANAAVEKLGRAGVRCTAEKSLPGWTRKGWYSVVTVNGYASQDRAFAKQVKALEAKGFEAHAYKWR
jgi:cell division septation protein DedD